MISLDKENDKSKQNVSPFCSIASHEQLDKFSYDENGVLYDDIHRLLKYDHWQSSHLDLLEPQSEKKIVVKNGTVTICDNAFEREHITELVIPETLCVIGTNALPHNCHIESESPNFITENGLLFSADKKRLLVNFSNKNAVIYIPDSVAFVDSRAFLDVDDESCAWAYDYPPYFMRINNPYINHFPTSYIRILVPSEAIKQQLIQRGFNKDSFIIGDVYVDSFGVVYSEDKKTLLCFPKESPLKTYEIIPECEVLADDAFYWLPDPEDDGSIDIRGNNLVSLVLPPNLKGIGDHSLQGLTSLQTLIYNQDNKDNILRMLESYKDYYVRNITQRVHLIPSRF